MKDDLKAQELTKQIASLAREKNVAKAVEVFQQFQRHGLHRRRAAGGYMWVFKVF